MTDDSQKNTLGPGVYLPSSDGSVSSDTSFRGSFTRGDPLAQIQLMKNFTNSTINSSSSSQSSQTAFANASAKSKRRAFQGVRVPTPPELNESKKDAKPTKESKLKEIMKRAASKRYGQDRGSSASSTVSGFSSLSEWLTGATSPNNTRNYRRFAVNDRVLVFLNILNHMQSTADEEFREKVTNNPVNKYGFPPGKGTNPEEQKGPFVYVLATVIMAHYEEDAIYYTIKRADTGSEQRANSDWMEPLKNHRGEAAAHAAAKQSIAEERKRELLQLNDEPTQKQGWCSCLAYPFRVVKKSLLRYRKSLGLWSEVYKLEVQRVLYGDQPYGFRVKFTGINFLVWCNFLFMFIDQLTIAFFPPSFDDALRVISLVIWFVLVIELFGEVFIRPNGYNALTVSDKAFAPSTARFINTFHLVMESFALLLFLPHVLPKTKDGDDFFLFGVTTSSRAAVLGPTRADVIVGRFWFLTVRLRIFGLVRHWKKTWLNENFAADWKLHTMSKSNDDDDKDQEEFMQKKEKTDEVTQDDDEHNEDNPTAQEDTRLRKAATIGTALMVINSNRAMMIMIATFGFLPLLGTIRKHGGANLLSVRMTKSLQAINVATGRASKANCTFLEQSVQSWLTTNSHVQVKYPLRRDLSTAYVLWAQVLPIRCPFQQNMTDGVITRCPDGSPLSACEIWNQVPAENPGQYIQRELNLRAGVLVEKQLVAKQVGFIDSEGRGRKGDFSVTVYFNDDHTISFVCLTSILAQGVFLIVTLALLTAFRRDAGRLVLDPLSRMLKIVLRYAANPLQQTPRPSTSSLKKGNGGSQGTPSQDTDDDSQSSVNNKDQLGHYETEQLINAIAKITDLLRKCWGVAGAGIISSNLARTHDGSTVVFNPTVPGRLVYALFAFVSINEFSKQLRALDKDVMILINDVAKVVHDEVFRWGLGDSGQCNKNLGSSFLMVFRIGDFKQVQDNLAKATDVIFKKKKSATKNASTLRKRLHGSKNNMSRTNRPSARSSTMDRPSHRSRRTSPKPRSSVISTSGTRTPTRNSNSRDSLQLSSLPGISAFTDRALLGMLKSFAGIYRDRHLLNWSKDFRLGAGVGAFSVDIIIGMDAGWAVEGAVGSEYKIDATYLSPHVNMAARMMTATNQYGVSILLSQAVEVLLSDPARQKLRHLDTIYVKGSSLKQKVYTYDARRKGVDFFLYEKSGDQADLDSDRYSPRIWELDQDLRAMRQHVSEEFLAAFNQGRDDYFAGNWKMAVKRLKAADTIMITTMIEEGYVDYDVEGIEHQILDPKHATDEIARLRNDIGDGACKCIISYIEKEVVPPKGWSGVRPLTRK
eukprot:CAMPEP_0118717148 /NCGR_PEP_ID=MMETSP0800-20121206/27951_1 /TAXON_ID=210618 ORGANISM="Striatella unipunctata, Strain CCMP2910" /NCGR_SAMPLE_ID=MMETSP0800 /ASSEMBLY_ACC=CAM_ASM_000638 /LENGTH=1321 /DNA_ID=CAMNT_0006623759 /DNA_START=80 /DNA_END=4045 /DNA_ORIENTATION=-